VRYSSKFGKIYNTSGREGLALKLKDGSKICIGTQKVSELKELVKLVSL